METNTSKEEPSLLVEDTGLDFLIGASPCFPNASSAKYSSSSSSEDKKASGGGDLSEEQVDGRFEKSSSSSSDSNEGSAGGVSCHEGGGVWRRVCRKRQEMGVWSEL